MKEFLKYTKGIVLNENKFKKTFKSSACARAPWAAFIEPGKRDSIMRQIRIECVQLYGYDLDTCPSRSVCIGKSCLGRELPWLSPTAKPYLEKMKQLGMITGDLYYVEDCSTCPIKNSCTSVCPMMNDFLNRHQSKQPEMVYQESMENYGSQAPERPVMPSELNNVTLPWDCLDPSKEALVKLRLEKRKDFLTIAKQCQLFDQKDARYEFYAALTKLSEYAIVREFIKENKENLTEKVYKVLTDVYINNKTSEQVAQEQGVTYIAIRKMVSRTLKKHSITWPIYVTKKKGKIVYNIPEVLQ